MTFSLAGFGISLIIEVLKVAGLPGLFALMAVESFGIPPLPSEVILTFAGLILAQGLNSTFTWPSVMATALAGGLTGSFVAYAVGAKWGLDFVHRVGRRFGVPQADLDRAMSFFDRRGPSTVFFARLVPLIRSYISYPAGAAGMGRVKFGVYTVAGAAPFTFALVYAGTVLGNNYASIVPYFNDMDVVIVALLVVLAVYLLMRARRAAKETEQTSGTAAARPTPGGSPSSDPTEPSPPSE